jgi:hypothetical protein
MTEPVKRYQKFNINDIDAFADFIPSMASAEKQPIHVKSTVDINPFAEYNELVGNDEFWNSKNVAVVNTRTRDVANVVSPNYRILQHQDYFSVVLEMLNQMGLTDVRGYILESDGGNSYATRLIVDSLEIDEPRMGRNLKVGFEFLNSYDATYAARGAAFFLRISCTNQMLLKNRIPECVFSRSHVAVDENALLEAVTEKTIEFTGQLVKSGAKFERVIADAIDAGYVFADREHLQAAMEIEFGTKKHAEGITDRAMQHADKKNGKLSLTAWDLYNSVTEHTSHSAMTPTVFENLLYKAERSFLSGGFTVPDRAEMSKMISA